MPISVKGIGQVTADMHGIQYLPVGTGVVIGKARPLHEERDGNAFNATGERRYVQKYLVQLGHKTAGKDDACKAPGIPRPWSPYVPFSQGLAADQAALVVDISARQKLADDWQFWVVTVTYSTNVGDAGPPQGGLTATGLGSDLVGAQNEPWKKRPRVEGDNEVIQMAFGCDLDGKKYVDTAGQFFNPPPQRRVACPVFMIYRNEKIVDFRADVLKMSRYAFAINSDVWGGFQPKLLQMYPIQYRLEWFGKIPYLAKTYKIVVFPESMKSTYRDKAVKTPWNWQTKILSRGLYEIGVGTDPTKPVPIFMPFGGRATTPQLLDKDGKSKKSDGRPVDPYYIDFKDFPELSFASILPSDILQTVGVYP